jgi:hypothetical protein
MTVDRFTYRRGAALPGITLYWDDGDGEPIDFSAGYTLSIELVPDDGGTTIDPDAVLTGGDGTFGIAWAVDDLDIPAGRYTLKPRAVENATSKPRDFNQDEFPIVQIVD